MLLVFYKSIYWYLIKKLNMHHIKKYIKILSFIKNEGLKKFLLNVSHRITSKFLKMLYKSI